MRGCKAAVDMEGMYVNNDEDYEQLMVEILAEDEDEDQQLYARHDVVNHSKNFVDPESGEHTNACEGKWGGLKRRIPHKNRNKYQLDEFFTYLRWREENWDRLWDAFLDLLRIVRYSGGTEDQPIQTPEGMGARAQFR